MLLAAAEPEIHHILKLSVWTSIQRHKQELLKVQTEDFLQRQLCQNVNK